MKLDWLRSISANVRIEGRNTVIVGLLVFCAIGMVAFLRRYENHPYLSLGFLIAFFLLAVAIGFVGLLAEPRPSEVSPKYVVQQVGPQIFMAGGFQSSDDLIELLKAAHNIRPLPLPVAAVKGKATDESSYKELSVSEAQEISKGVDEGVRGLLRVEAQRILNAIAPGQLTMSSGRALVPSNNPPAPSGTDEPTAKDSQP